MQLQNSPAAAAPAPLPVASATKTKNDLKPSPPPNFDGDRQKGRGFINACQAYFRIRPDNFPDEQVKIRWVMTFMNQGRAQKWANRIYRWESTPANSGNDYFVDWDDFRSRFRTEFYPSTRKPLPPTAWKEQPTSKADEPSMTTLTTSET